MTSSSLGSLTPIKPKRLFDRFMKWLFRWAIKQIRNRNRRLEIELQEAREQLYHILHIDPIYDQHQLYIEDLEDRLDEGRKKLNEAEMVYVNTYICRFNPGGEKKWQIRRSK